MRITSQIWRVTDIPFCFHNGTLKSFPKTSGEKGLFIEAGYTWAVSAPKSLHPASAGEEL